LIFLFVAKCGKTRPFMKRLFLVLLLGACSGNGQPIDIDGGGVDATADVTKIDAGGSDVVNLGDSSPVDTGPGDAGVDAPNPDLGCLNDDAGCVACCFANHPDGSATYFDTLTNCACKTGATCHSATICLNNLCKGYDPSPACDKCLSNPDAGDCYNNADKACGNDPDCVAFFDCALNVCSPPPTDASTD
jgi:hypothetical protein